MEPSYSLNRIRELFQEGRFRVARSAFEAALLMSLLEEDVVDCVTCHLNESHFYKTMPAEKVPGLMQDVYKIRYEGWRIYLKLQIDKDGRAVVISFKEDESAG